MNRRTLISSASILGASAVASSALANTAPGSALSKKASDLEVLYACISAAQTCIDACLDELADGKVEGKAESIRACRDCIAICTTIAQLLASDSRHVKAAAALCVQACQDCIKYCDDGDAACKACVEACRACIAVCEKLAA